MWNPNSGIYYCDAKDCKSKNKLIKTTDDIKNDHSDHFQKMEKLDYLREILIKEDHPLKGISKVSGQDDSNKLYQLINDGIEKLIKDFTIVATEMKEIFNKYKILIYTKLCITSRCILQGLSYQWSSTLKHPDI